MAELTGNDILARCLKAQGVKDIFFIMGGPMLDAELCSIKEGIRLIDTRHEQGAAYMAQAYSRVTQGPGVCMAASGPATLNFSTGLANALIDGCPVVALGGSSPISQFGRQVFQEIDQVRALDGCVKYADRVHNLKRMPQQVNFAFQKALNGKPGPVYLDFPGDVLYTTVDEARRRLELYGPADHQGAPLCRAQGAQCARRRDWPGAPADHRLGQRCAVVAGLGRDEGVCREGRDPVLHDPAGARRRPRRPPLFLPDDAQRRIPRGRSDHHPRHPHELRDRPRRCRRASAPTPRSRASRSTPRRWATRRATSTSRSSATASRYCSNCARRSMRAPPTASSPGARSWPTARRKKRIRAGGNYPTDGDIHPLRLCEEIKNFMQREAILSVDGQEILNFGRQSIPTFVPGHRLNSGPFGTMGVGLPFAVGAKAAKPYAQVICLHGDGSFGQNAMELDTAVRAQIAAPVHHQPQRRLDRRPRTQQARPRSWLHALRQDGRGARLLRRICRRARGHPPGPAACLEEGRGRHGRLRQRQDRLPRPRHDGALFQPRDLSGRPRVTEGAPAGAPFTWRHRQKQRSFAFAPPNNGAVSKHNSIYFS